MISRYVRTRFRRLKRSALKVRALFFAAVVLLLGGIGGYTYYMKTRTLAVDPTSYTALLNTIARVESKDNYNAYFGHAANTSTKFTDMTIAQVLEWQKSYIAQGNPSDAVGRYQIISTTLTDLVAKLQLDPTQKFSPSMQDKLAIALLERRGSIAYVNKQVSRQQFAANLAKEWAALPRVIGPQPQASYYAGDGLNSSLVSVQEILQAIEPIKPE